MPTEGTVIAIYKLNGKFYASVHGTELCPLVPVPPHGDLISRSELDRSFTALRFNGNELVHWGDRKDWCLHGSEIENLINNAPTVIEAEGENNG